MGGPGGPGGPESGSMGSGDAMAQGGPGGVASVAVRMGMQIDMQLKQLAQIMPLMGPWVQQVGEQLKVQLAQALQGGAGAPVMPAQGMQQFPDGSGRL
jgi:hypothetical protein